MDIYVVISFFQDVCIFLFFWVENVRERAIFNLKKIDSSLQLQLNLTLLLEMIHLLSILAHSTIQLHTIEFILCLLAAVMIGYESGKRKALSSTVTKPKETGLEVVPASVEEQRIDKRSVVDYADKQVQNVSVEETSLAEKGTTEIQEIDKDGFPNEMLKEKVELQLKKIQSTSYFQTRLQPSRNTRYMRKIEKHEIVTDYELQQENPDFCRLVPFKNNPISALSEPHSLLEVVAHQDYNIKLPSPWFERKLISLGKLNEGWKHQIIPPCILENGRFNRFFHENKIIGQGGFGKVYEAVNLLENKKYAIKKLVMKGMVKMGELLNEALIISKYNHPNIVNFYSCWIELATIDEAALITASLPALDIDDANSIKIEKEMNYVQSNSGFTFQKSSKKSKTVSIRKSQRTKKESQLVSYQTVSLVQIYTLHIQMELCQTSLHNLLRQRKNIEFAESFRIFQQIVLGLNFLHSNGIVHRDLKPANILLSYQDKKVKIGDFGLAALVSDHSELIHHEKVGTPLYMAPEMKNGNQIEKGNLDLVDIYSTGVIYFQLLHMLNEATQHQRSEKLLALQSNKVQISSKDLKEEKKMIKLLTKTFNRPNIKEVLESKQLAQLRRKYSNKAEL